MAAVGPWEPRPIAGWPPTRHSVTPRSPMAATEPQSHASLAPPCRHRALGSPAYGRCAAITPQRHIITSQRRSGFARIVTVSQKRHSPHGLSKACATHFTTILN